MKKNKSNCIFISLILLLTVIVGLSFINDKNSTINQTVQASSRLKRAYIPKRFRGTWYANKHDKMKITANSIGGNVVGKTYTNFYHGGYKNVVDGVSKHNLVRYKGKSMIILFARGGSDTTLRVVSRHHNKALYFQQGGGYIYFYRSRATAKRYGNY